MMTILMVHTLLALLAPAWMPIAGQVPDSLPDAGAQGPAGPLAPVRLERAAFTYVVAGRRDPFLPTAPSVEAGPRFQEPRLLGIISHADPRLGVAVIRVLSEPGAGEPGQGDYAAGSGVDENYRLRAGDRVGDIHLISIHERHVVVEVSGPDSLERLLLRLPEASQGRAS